MAEKVSSIKWFGMALKALIVLASNEGLCPSGKLAEKLESKSVFLRKILTHLVKAELIQAKEGRDGGYSLVKRPEEIKLSEIYEAVKAETIPKDLFETDSKDCFVPETQLTLSELRDDMEDWILNGLSDRTLADYIKR
ncbi:Rrf2 family transcriptional regulator [Halobacillus sp. ACCC02827]|uniref:RrF2 family transcriptional regulator n=1 Tax=Bacillaceae TaxID=186817 RepID=UPI0002A4E338|nr:MULTISPECIES: Rrf2 family transcriptional regulator [Bacillaceae]ELK45924.1 BadM/Rrf2 family transcriptional regulator [Halobacillus sp. BAB-2008]QHT45267.1 Rrf2 family transcriptional regulator [Bacillus sp. SB49]WJE16047.1 Rrf2 family transcriptional regulator [Halobacillus sp. ACCC02827]